MSIEDRYAHATNSKNLLLAEGACDADVLIGAGLAGQSKRLALGLALARMREGGSLDDVHHVSDELAGMLSARCAKRRERVVSGEGAKKLALVAILTWLDPVCNVCGGHGHPVMQGAPVLDLAVMCPACHGTGRSSHAVGLTHRQVDLVDWRVAEATAATSDAMGRMAGLLK